MSRAVVMETIPALLHAALGALKARREEIDHLNVFPVPDGDTGTNLVLTMESVCSRVDGAGASPADLADAATLGALMGARGNSGVILSQMIRGFFSLLAEREEFDADCFIQGLRDAVRAAYEAVKEPAEGTMLTVLREGYEAVADLAGVHLSIEDVLTSFLRAAQESLDRTPELLPPLRAAGVVDAGGCALVVMARGVLSALQGEQGHAPIKLNSLTPVPEIRLESIRYTYCTELVVKGSDLDKEALEGQIGHLGDSLLVVGTSERLKVHIHTNNPGFVIEAAAALGSLVHVQVNNMVEQVAERMRVALSQQSDAVAVIAVAAGRGVSELFESLGAGRIVEGGQSMNPSTGEILAAARSVASQKVIILPNNKNVILSAEQVSSLVDFEVVVVPTRSVAEGLAAMLGFDPGKTLEENERDMLESSAGVRTGEVTMAVRDTDGVRKGDFIGLMGGEIAATGSSLLEATFSLFDAMVAEDVETATVIAGSDVLDEEAAELLDQLTARYADLEIDFQRGGQPLYHLIIGAE